MAVSTGFILKFIEMDSIWRSKYGSGYRRMARPVVVRAYDYQHGYREIWHSHEQAQLVYATRGVVRILTPSGSWLVPPGRALWIAPGIDHELHTVGEVALRSAYFEPETVPWIRDFCSVIDVSPLLGELLVGMLGDPLEYAEDSRAALIVPVLLRCLKEAPMVDQGMLPLPSDRRLRQLCEGLMKEPGDNNTLDVWANRVGVSARTLARLFREETGLTFGQWRQQMRISEAVYRLALKEPVRAISAELGYSTPAAFITMFKKTLGITPQRYLSGRSSE